MLPCSSTFQLWRNEMTKYLTCAETAKLIRTALKEAFPGVKFSVKSSVYSGGASININYENGPTCSQVKSVVSVFEGSYFDGMTDYKGSNYTSLNGEEVRFGADFVFVTRKYTKAFLEGAVEAACKYYGYPVPAIVDSSFGAYVERTSNYDNEMRIMRKVEEFTLVEIKESKTAESVKFLGDDGYGYGAVGRLAA